MERYDDDRETVDLGAATEETKGGNVLGQELGGFVKAPTGIDADD